MSPAKVPKYIQNYLQEDVDDILDRSMLGDSVSTHVSWDSPERNVYDVNVEFTDGSHSVELEWTYVEESDGCYMDESCEDLAKSLDKKWSEITSAKSIRSKQPIMAADDDDAFSDFDEYADDDDGTAVSGDEDFGDTLDDIADGIDDMQDSIDEMEEDDEDIDIENNIDGHFIAECDNCHGVFISAVIMSDQPVESIHGTCPLCEKESDQYLKWVIQDVKKLEEQALT